jgi:hypothetical protein
MAEEQEIFLLHEDIITVTCEDNVLMLVYKSQNTTCVAEIEPSSFRSLFPNITYTKDQFAFTSRDAKFSIPVDPSSDYGKKFIAAANASLEQFNDVAVKKYNALVVEAGLENEHCAIFCDKILFHSKSTEKFKEFLTSIPNIVVTEYHPSQ